ncbi:MAG TPA: RsmE family RNA methyltransferase [Puia sp.]|nr:RsmE family RNA methyltransferase [Puia sp.]
MMLPYFYIPFFDPSHKEIQLDEDTSKHAIQVLRMKRGGKLQLTDGKGNVLTAVITGDQKKKCIVEIEEAKLIKPEGRKITIAISLLRNTSRFEWFLEKATEIGISEIIPLICERTEKQHFRMDRMKNILVSAMLQSQQAWLPVLHEPIAFEKAVDQSRYDQKFIAHCLPDKKMNLADIVNESLSSQIILVGPEGDFTTEEIALALNRHFVPVALGQTRLRSETAGIVAAAILKNSS